MLARVPGWLRWIAAAALLAALAALVAATVAGRRAREQVAHAAAIDARLRAALLDSELARFRLMPLALSDDRDIVAALGGGATARDRLNRKLAALARSTGAGAIYLIGRQGHAIAASNAGTARSFVGRDYRFRRYYRLALTGGEASQFALGTVSGKPGLYLARRTGGSGVIVVKLEFDRVEAAWRAAGDITYVRNPLGLLVVTSRPAWRFTTTRPLSPAALDALRAEASIPAHSLRRLAAPADGEVLHRLPVSQPGWELTLRRDASPTVAAAQRAAILGAVLAVLALATLFWGLRQRALLNRRRTAQLEQAVAERTADLTREMEERAASEARAAALREGLRQANRLATLGQVTAGVAHETAQPVAAIRTYAENGMVLLDRGDAGAVRTNLDAICRLSDRIGAVTAELRGFSRRRAGETRQVMVEETIDGALLILREQLRAVTLVRSPPQSALCVLGGRVRLEQVLVNLLQNAIEALDGTADPRIAVEVSASESEVAIAIADNGPGVPAEIEARLFTPFATSRAEGLGLGLAIAQDIMVDMGGSLRLAANDGGARFVLALGRG